MRLIDADELMQLYEDGYGFDFSGYHVAVPVIRQNILEMRTIEETPCTFCKYNSKSRRGRKPCFHCPAKAKEE